MRAAPGNPAASPTSRVAVGPGFEAVGVHEGGVAEDFGRGAVGDDPAFVDEDHPLTEATDQGDVVRGETPIIMRRVVSPLIWASST